MAQLRNSKQRTAVLDLLASRYDHPTAEQLYFDLKKTMPSISLAPVYRNLRLLEQEGQILALHCGDAVHFDYNTELHYHFLCRKCSSIIDVEINGKDNLDEMVCPFGGKVEGHTMMFYGICGKCLAENESN